MATWNLLVLNTKETKNMANDVVYASVLISKNQSKCENNSKYYVIHNLSRSCTRLLLRLPLHRDGLICKRIFFAAVTWRAKRTNEAASF